MKAIIVCVDTWKALILIKFCFNLSIFITYEESIVKLYESFYFARSVNNSLY